MTGSEFVRRIQPYVESRWLERFVVSARRRRLGRIDKDIQQAEHTSRRLFVDLSVIAQNDSGTGIQRVVRSVASSLLTTPPEGWEIIPVGATRKNPYRRIAWRNYGEPGEFFCEADGDVFLGLDFSLDDVHRHRRQLRDFVRRGGFVWFFMYDLLPLEKPDWFSDRLVVRFRRWLRSTASVASGYFCISGPVQAELDRLLIDRYGVEDGVKSAVIPMGWDFGVQSSKFNASTNYEALLNLAKKIPAALMVGTIEPRKGHADVVAAFDVLWAQGSEALLIIVGRPGWKTDDVISSIQANPHFGKKLYWLTDADDEALHDLYKVCTGVIAASHGEGYGLPIMEGLARGKPVLARRIDVFEMHQGQGLFFFDAKATTVQLSSDIKHWLNNVASQPAPQREFTRWSETISFLLAELHEEK